MLPPRQAERALASNADYCLEIGMVARRDTINCDGPSHPAFVEQSRASLTRAWSCAATTRQTLILAYGVNDCEAKLAEVPLSRAWQMLSPLPGETDVCSQ